MDIPNYISDSSDEDDDVIINDMVDDVVINDNDVDKYVSIPFILPRLSHPLPFSLFLFQRP
jgi:hypothetical protein